MSTFHVVVAYDFTKPADIALQQAVELVARNPHQSLHFVAVIDSRQSYQAADRIRDELLAHLKRTFAAHEPQIDLDFYVHVRIGDPAEEILGLANEIGASMIVLGCHDRSALGRFLLGSVSTEVLHHAHCPVFVARPIGYTPVELQKIVEVIPGPRRPLPHRYSYNSAIAQVRPSDWPI